MHLFPFVIDFFVLLFYFFALLCKIFNESGIKLEFVLLNQVLLEHKRM